jgi:hypothetical protein
VGVAVSIGQDGVGVSIFAEGSYGKGHEKGNGSENQNSHLTATENLAITSERDTTIAGAVLTGESVTMDIGRDLTLASRQDTDVYEARQEQISAKAKVNVYGAGNSGASASYSLDTTNSDYASVVEQTGIYAGEGGFDINVGGNTSLTGAVIASEADPSQNRLSTQTIDFADIQNYSEYDAKSINVSASTQSMPSGSVSHQSDSDSGTTRSAIAEGEITVRSDYDENGNRIADSLANLSRDTANANGSVENKFDLEKIQEQREMGQVVGEVGFGVVGTVTAKIYEQKMKKLDEDHRSGAISDEDYKSELAAINTMWGEGGYAKTALHAATGATQAALGGGDALGGALGAGVSEAFKGTREFWMLAKGKTGKELASALIGYIVGGESGAIAALDGDKYNRQLHAQEWQKLIEVAWELAQGDKDKYAEIYPLLVMAALDKVHAGAELPEDDQGRQKLEALAKQGANMTALSDYLSKYEAEGLFTYTELDRLKDMYASTGQLPDEYYTIVLDDQSRAVKQLNDKGLAVRSAYEKDQAEGLYDYKRGDTIAQPAVDWINRQFEEKVDNLDRDLIRAQVFGEYGLLDDPSLPAKLREELKTTQQQQLDWRILGEYQSGESGYGAELAATKRAMTDLKMYEAAKWQDTRAALKVYSTGGIIVANLSVLGLDPALLAPEGVTDLAGVALGKTLAGEAISARALSTIVESQAARASIKLETSVAREAAAAESGAVRITSIELLGRDAMDIIEYPVTGANRVLWSGGDTARIAAENFAKQLPGGTTLEMLNPALKPASDALLAQGADWATIVRPTIWEPASRKFADEITNSVDVFLREGGVSPKSVWNEIELKILQSKPEIKIEYHIVKPDGTVITPPPLPPSK